MRLLKQMEQLIEQIEDAKGNLQDILAEAMSLAHELNDIESEVREISDSEDPEAMRDKAENIYNKL